MKTHRARGDARGRAPASRRRRRRRTSINWEQPVPSRFAAFEEVAALCEAAGEGGAGSIVYPAGDGRAGLDHRDRERLIELGAALGLPVVMQGMGYRPGKRRRLGRPDAASSPTRATAARRSTRCSARSRSCGRSTGDRGTSLFDGVFHWRDLGDAAGGRALRRARRCRGPRRSSARRSTSRTPTARKGSTLPPPALDAVFVDRVRNASGSRGEELAAAREGARRACRRRDVRPRRRRRARHAVPLEQREPALDRGERRVAARTRT